MSDLSAAQFRRFMRGDFTDSIRRAYKSHQILCEADLQSFAWYRIKQFLKRAGGSRGEFRVLNKPFLRKSNTYPDLVVFKAKVPWAVIELKESKRLPERTALSEREKLRLAKGSYIELKRGYLVYVARYGDRRALRGPKGDSAYYFSEVPVVMWRSKAEADKEWIKEFRSWSKYAP
ncbi:MAG: hypothetical protein WAM69_11995 [Candidatus Sulfotelmatobacter sp.]